MFVIQFLSEERIRLSDAHRSTHIQENAMTLSSKKCYFALMAAVFSLALANTAMAEKYVSRSLDDLTWVNGGPGIDFALVWGDWTKNDYAMIVKIKAGAVAPRHSHTSDYHGVTIQENGSIRLEKTTTELCHRVLTHFNLGKRIMVTDVKALKTVSSSYTNMDP